LFTSGAHASVVFRCAGCFGHLILVWVELEVKFYFLKGAGVEEVGSNEGPHGNVLGSVVYYSVLMLFAFPIK
jgi:hypothetical protein